MTFRRAGCGSLCADGTEAGIVCHPAPGTVHLRGDGLWRAAVLAVKPTGSCPALQQSAVFAKVAAYYKQLFDRLRPYLGENGGNIIAVQVENEYGSYGNDKDYLRAVAQIYRDNGVNEFFFTSDGPDQLMLGGGSLPEYLATANFGSRGKEHFDTLRGLRPNDR